MGKQYVGPEIVTAFKIGNVLFASPGFYWLLDDVQDPNDRTCILKVSADFVKTPSSVIGSWLVARGEERTIMSDEAFQKDFKVAPPEEVSHADVGPTLEYNRMTHGRLSIVTGE